MTTTQTRPTVNGDPALQSALAKLAELSQQMHAAEAQWNKLRSTMVSPKRADLDRAAADLLTGGDLQTVVATESELRTIEREYLVLRRAVELQQAAVRDARHRAERAIRTSMLDEHKALARDIDRGIQIVLDALQAERDLMDGLGCDFGAPLESIQLTERTRHVLQLWRDEHQQYIE